MGQLRRRRTRSPVKSFLMERAAMMQSGFAIGSFVHAEPGALQT
eukprot:SAG31_NODE_1073_length_10065_cov_2.176701_5_plen_44_part_00